jgi:protein-tyrosine phosphatase
MSADQFDRIIAFEGAKNVRDLGGLETPSGARVRPGVVFRGDGLSRLTAADLAQLIQLGVRTIIDLRYEEERARAPDRLPPELAPRCLQRGFFPQGSRELFTAINEHGADAAAAFELMSSNYSRMPFEHARELGAVLHDLLDPSGAPHFIHCTSGKDRTGVAIALILRALGVDVDTAVADYALSNCEHQAVDVFGPAARPDAIAMVMSAHPGYLRAALDAIDREYGHIDDYLSGALAFGAAERAALRQRMLA